MLSTRQGDKMNKVLSRKFYKIGYEVREELVDGKTYGGDDFNMKIAYTYNGDYIGGPETAYNLCVKRGILPQKRTENSNVCSIGYSQKDGKWYGWSHRAIYGFKIGDIVKKGDCCTSSGWTEEYLKDHPDNDVLPIGFEAKIKEDCKRMAIAFASSVS